MASLNKVFLLGNLTRDPDLRGLPNGQSVCELRLAVSRRYVNGAGQDTEETCFVDVVVWGRSAGNCKQYLAKGSQVMVEGRLQLDQWEDRNGGGQRSRLRVVAEQVQFMNRRPSADGGYGAPGTSGPVAAPGPDQYQSRPQGGDYVPRQSSAPRQSYGAPRGDYGAPRQGAPSVPPAPPEMDAPPMPEPGADAGPDGGMVDDIPF